MVKQTDQQIQTKHRSD